MSSTVISPSGKILHHRASRTTTPSTDSKAKVVRIKPTKEERLAENKEYLKDANIQAFIKAIAKAEGGEYDFKFGAIKGKRNDPWRFSDYSTHPGAGYRGSTAAGMYQITKDTWHDHGETAMGLTDFTPQTQDLIAVEMLRSVGVIDKIKAGEIADSMAPVARKWAALSEGPGKGNRYPPQPFVSYAAFVQSYIDFGGGTK